jgi:Zn-dependent peptidase ImmA (M78 family)
VEYIAQRVREALRIPEGPIHNLTGYIEMAGGVIFDVDFDSDLVDGTNIRVPGIPPLLFLNKNVSGCRHRFNIAHELGHLVMHAAAAGPGSSPEDEANTFAAEFLMPRTLIRSDLRNLDLQAAQRLKQVWGVSMAAIILRAYTIGAISQGKYKRLFQQMSAMNIRRVEPGFVEFEPPSAFRAMVDAFTRSVGADAKGIRKILFTDNLGVIPPQGGPPALRLFDYV